jgi:tetratricopeptide (TPR) repeat protein/transcriptional regulator with XRE-family HTH domain
VAEVPVPFGGVLRGLRTEAGLTQEELAEAAGLTARAISYLERGEVSTPHKATVQLLAGALQLTGRARAEFEAAARGHDKAGAAALPARTLPRDIASFTGRQQELAALAAAAAAAGAVVSIHAIGGMAGVGKTAFAVHAAHVLASRFPDGQIFLPLHGHTPGRQPADPADALSSLLLTTGLSVAQIPATVEARIAVWRERVAGRQLLLILDDATGSEQIRPLLPGAGGTLVLITSRRHLSALDDAAVISLDTLPPGEAAMLLARLAGKAGVDPEDPAVGELNQLCGFLPLAIGMMARQLRHHPTWTPAERAAELTAATSRLELMATENLSVAAAFDLSYSGLTGEQQRLFRRLGLHPGPDVDSYAAAALDSTDPSVARRSLEDLYDQYLLTEPTPGRYRLHDLIREHARTLAGRLDGDEDRDAATRRLMDYYQHTAARADAQIARHTRPVGSAQTAARAAAPALTGPEQALAWLRAERASLLSCLDQAGSSGNLARVTALTASLSGLMERDGPWADAITRHTAAIEAAQHSGDRLGQANALNDLGAVRRLTGEYSAALQAHEQALAIYCQVRSQLGEANALNCLGLVRRATGDFPAAAQAHRQALTIYRQIGNQLGEANALHYLGTVSQVTGDYPAATRAQQQALAIYRRTGNQVGEATALNFLGIVQYLTGDYPAAAQALEHALRMYRQMGNQHGEANALNSLGNVRWLTRDYPAAAQAQQQALAIYRQMGNQHGEANALSSIGSVLRLTGDYPAAARAQQQVLSIVRRLGNRSAESEALNEMGTLHRVTGDLALAEECHEQALELARATGTSWNEAHALAGLARCALAAGRAGDAAAGLQQALDIFERIGSTEAAEVSAELGAITAQAGQAGLGPAG